MRQLLVLSGIVFAFSLISSSCKKRHPLAENEVGPESNAQTEESLPALPSKALPAAAKNSRTTVETSDPNGRIELDDINSEVEIEFGNEDEPSTEKKVRTFALKFAVGKDQCLEVAETGTVSVKPCLEDKAGQNFQRGRGFDGRIQIRDINSQLCLASTAEIPVQNPPPGGLPNNNADERDKVFALKAETCEGKFEQNFSIVDYGSSFSIRQDKENVCIEAIGAEVLLRNCTGDNEQRFVRQKAAK